MRMRDSVERRSILDEIVQDTCGLRGHEFVPSLNVIGVREETLKSRDVVVPVTLRCVKCGYWRWFFEFEKDREWHLEPTSSQSRDGPRTIYDFRPVHSPSCPLVSLSSASDVERSKKSMSLA